MPTHIPLSLPPQGGQPAIVDFLLQHGADVNAQNWRGQTALHFAYAFLYLPLADRLVTSGARRDIQNFYGEPRLFSHTDKHTHTPAHLLICSPA